MFDAATPVDPEPYTGAHPNVYFSSPSGNIGCYIFIDYGNRIECTISRYEFDQPGPDCDTGAIVGLDESGRAYFEHCATDEPFTDRILRYDRSITNGRLACVSTTANVTCLDLDTDTGFTLSREAFRTVN